MLRDAAFVKRCGVGQHLTRNRRRQLDLRRRSLGPSHSRHSSIIQNGYHPRDGCRAFKLVAIAEAANILPPDIAVPMIAGQHHLLVRSEHCVQTIPNLSGSPPRTSSSA
jgi:hypothetical protein